MNNLKLILGGPGCGKTTRLLNIVEQEIEDGVNPKRIALVTFTRAAAREAQERAAEKFGLDPSKDLPWFRTVHSLAYTQLGMTSEELLNRQDWKDFSELVGWPVNASHRQFHTDIMQGTDGDVMLRIVEYAATTMSSLVDVWHMMNEPIEWHKLVYFDRTFSNFKSEVGRFDFTDMLIMYAQGEGLPVPADVAIIDEAQDLTAAQWDVCERAFAGAQRVYVGGDDDQAIYRWAGADVERFLTLSRRPEVLPRSYRLPRAVFDLSQRVASRISRRYPKPFLPSDKKGSVEWHTRPEFVHMDPHSDDTWLLLARNNYSLRKLESIVRDRGLVYSTREGPSIDPENIELAFLWERFRTGKVERIPAKAARNLIDLIGRGVRIPQMVESEFYALSELGLAKFKDVNWHNLFTGISDSDINYILSCIATDQLMKDTKRIRIETIHGVKGAEADHVLLGTDMSRRTAQGFEINPDTEHRVYYVGITRARKSLQLIMPLTNKFYPMPR